VDRVPCFLMEALRARTRRGAGVAAGLGLLLALLASAPTALGQPAGPTTRAAGRVARVAVRITSDPTAPTVSGVLVALDASGQAIADITPEDLQTTLDGRPVDLSLATARPPIALAAAFLLDSSASPQVRDALAKALAIAVQALDLQRDAVAIVSTANRTPWDAASFSTSADELTAALSEIIQADPSDSMVSLEQVSGALKSLSGQPRAGRVLLLLTNRPLASAATAAATLGSLRAFAVENGVQIAVVALSGAGGQGVAESLVEATPGGGVEYVLNATNLADISHRIGLLLAPALGARHFEVPAPADEGTHVLSVGAPGGAFQVTQRFAVTGRPIQVDSLVIGGRSVKAFSELKEPLWVQVRPASAGPIDNVEWNVDGRVTQVASEPWAVWLDPEQLGDGRHELTARIISQGRAGPSLTSTLYVPADFVRTARGAVRAWGLIAALLLANTVVVVLLVRMRARPWLGGMTEFPPALRLNQLGGRYVAPEVLHFPTRGKLRIGYHPPYMDNHVGSREFSRLPFQDIRGDEDTVADLSRHVGCLWREPKTNDCYVQLGWPGPGEAVVPKPQSQVFHLGRPQDATSRPFRLAHHDVLRLATGVEFVFYQVGLRDKPTPEGKKLETFEGRALPPPIQLAQERQRRAAAEGATAEES